MNVFRVKYFPTYFASRSFANLSDSIYSIAILWLIQTSTLDASMNGFVYAAISSAALCSIFFGPVVDRYAAATLAGIALLFQAVIVFTIPLIFSTDLFIIALIIGLVFIASLFSALYYPANNKLLTLLIHEPDQLQAANAAIGSSDQVINLVGYLAGGALIGWLGIQNAYLLSAALFLLAGVSFLGLLTKKTAQSQQEENLPSSTHHSSIKERFSLYLSEIKAGFSFINQSRYLKIILPSTIISGAIIALLIIILPMIGEQYGSALYYSGLYVAFFIGFFIGAILSNALKAKGLYVAIAWLGNGLALVLFGLAPNWWMTATSLLLFGTCSGVMNVIQMSLIQVMTPAHLMGRVMATLSTVNNVATPIGSLIGGLLLLSFDVQSIIITSAIIFILLSGFLLSQTYFTQFNIDDAKQFKTSFDS